MTFEPPPSQTAQMRAHEALDAAPPYLLRGSRQGDVAWKLVAEPPSVLSLPGLSRVVAVTYVDGSVRLFEPEDVLFVGPVTERTEGDRRDIRDIADAHGWRRIVDGADFFTRGAIRVEVHYKDATAVTARRLLHGRPTTFFTSGNEAKSSAIDWLSANRTHPYLR